MSQMRLLGEWLFLPILLGLCIQDIKTRSLSQGLLILAFLPGCAVGFLTSFAGEADTLLFLAGLIPGVFFWLISRGPGRHLGEGDGFVLMAMGALLGFSRCMLALSVALLLCAFCAGFLLAVRKSSRKMRIPFVPFLAVGYLAGMCTL